MSMASGLFGTIDLAPHIAAERRADQPKWERATANALGALPSGWQTFWGVPFDLSAGWLLLGKMPGLAPTATVTLEGAAGAIPQPTYLVFLHMCAVPSIPDDGKAP